MKSNFTGLKWSATAGRPRWKKSKFMTVPLTIFRLSPSPKFERWVWPPHLKNCSTGPVEEMILSKWVNIES